MHRGSAPQRSSDHVGHGFRRALGQVWLAHSRVAARSKSQLVDHHNLIYEQGSSSN